MLNPLILLGLALALGIAILTFVGVPQLARLRWGRLVVLVGAGLLPLAMSGATLTAGVKESSRTRFCLQCHEMQSYGRSLFVDDRKSLPAAHYQDRLIDRDETCFACHTDYAMWGDFKAKLNGLKHVWVHYLGKVPEKMELYQPYPNYNCLHCHDDARSFAEAPVHRGLMPALRAGETSCLQCHKIVHDMAAVHAGRFWQADAPPAEDAP